MTLYGANISLLGVQTIEFFECKALAQNLPFEGRFSLVRPTMVYIDWRIGTANYFLTDDLALRTTALDS